MPAFAIDRAVTSGLLIPMHPAVYRSAMTPTWWEQRVAAACAWAAPHAVASHRCAAALWKLDGFKPGMIEITTTRQVSDRGVIVHRSRDWMAADATCTGGIPVTTVHRTLIDLGAVVRSYRVEIALDSALSQRLTSVTYLWRRLNRLGGRGRSGSAALRGMLVERMGLTGHAQNGAETRLARLLKGAGIEGYQEQFEIFDGDELVARPDFAWPALRLAVELDSWRWHSSTSARRRDARRQNRMERIGWMVLRLFWEDVLHDSDYVLGETKLALAVRSPSIVV